MFISVHILYFSTFKFDHIILSKVKARKCPEILAFKVIISNHVFPLLGFKTKVVKVELGPTHVKLRLLEVSIRYKIIIYWKNTIKLPMYHTVKYGRG